MQAGIYVAAAVVGICVIGGVVLLRKFRSKRTTGQTEEEFFRDVWAALLLREAPVFCGLYSGLHLVTVGKAKKPEKILREWCQRTHYKWEDKQADVLCMRHLKPAVESGDGEALAKWAKLLLAAAELAGVTRGAQGRITLTEESACAYEDWEGSDIYPEDEVEILAPAWYQNDVLLEKGQCRKAEASASE